MTAEQRKHDVLNPLDFCCQHDTSILMAFPACAANAECLLYISIRAAKGVALAKTFGNLADEPRNLYRLRKTTET